MAPVKKSPSSHKTRSSSSKGPHIAAVKGENFYRNAKQVGRRKMLSSGKPVRDKDGKIIQAAPFQKGEADTKPGRVQPDRRWFGNTRVISQTALDHFRSSLVSKKDDPYSVLLRRNKLPMALLDEALNPNIRKRSHIVETEPFSDTFGPKAQRKRPKVDAGNFEELSKFGAQAAENESKNDVIGLGPSSTTTAAEFKTHADLIEPIYSKGTSRRIYGELYKVIDSSDVILHVLDARDPMGTICQSVLDYIKKEKAHKQVVLIINKCDLVPNWVTARYIQHLTPRYPTIAFHASPNHSFGKGALIQLLRQFAQLHSNRKQISVGFIGYPNVGKSSVINTLKSSKVCRVAPIPGETKVWQYISLTRRIYLIDCPGIVPTSAHDTHTSTVLKGVVRVEALSSPTEHIPTLMERVKPIYLSRTYGVPLPDENDPSIGWESEAFLDKLARMKGRLLKGGEPDLDSVAKIVLSDWVRGRVPYFVPPPERPPELNEVEVKKSKSKGNPVDSKDKAKVNDREGEPRLGVVQNLGSIMQKNTFLAEDMRQMETEFVQQGQEEDTGEDEDDADTDSSEEEPLSWNDVYGQQASSHQATMVDDRTPPQDSGSSESDSEPRVVKETRIKTNKRKATNFYTHTNVKNKNRNKTALLKSLSSRKGDIRKNRNR